MDNFHYDRDDDYVIHGFSTEELAREFARRWVRDSLEDLREPGQTHEELRRLWYTFGDDAYVIGSQPRYAGSHDLDEFIAHPATPEERDWRAIKKLAGIE